VQVRDEFLSIASHELKTPLTSLQLQIDSLTRQIDRRPEAALQSGRLASGAKAVADQTIRLAELVDVLLDVSRITSGRLHFENSELDLVEVVGAAVDRWRPASARVGIEPVVQRSESDVTTELPAALSGTWDRLRLEQVLGNLLSNAVKYGAGQPICVQVSGDEARARIRVIDHGIGIAPVDQRRIFERFERAASSRHYGGLGLGLWISRQLVEAMGGSIGVESAPGRGSVFIVELPRKGPVATKPQG